MRNLIVNRTHFFIAFTLCVFVMRYAFTVDTFPFLHAIFSGFKFIAWAILFIFFLKHPGRPDSVILLFAVYFVFLLYTSVIHHTDAIVNLLTTSIDVFFLWAICKMLLPEHSSFIVKTLILAFSACIYFNFLLMIVKPNGLYTTFNGNSYFLLGGNHNQMGRSIITAITLNGYYALQHGKLKKNMIFLIIVSFITLLWVGSKTSLVGLTLMTLFYLLRSPKMKTITFCTFIVVYAVMQIMVVVLQKDISGNRATVYVVEKVLHKDLSFSGRTIVWIKSLSLVEQSPVIGHGVQSTVWHRERLGVTTTHNIFLHQLVNGGVILLLLFCFMIVQAMWNYLKHNSEPTQYICFGFWLFMFMMMMEVYSFPIVAIYLFMLDYTKHLNVSEQ